MNIEGSTGTARIVALLRMILACGETPKRKGKRMSKDVDLDDLERLAAAATPGPWAFASAPADGSEETAAEYLAGAMTGDGPLFVVWLPATEGNPGGYRLTAATGDGLHASYDAEFIAEARTAVPALIAELREARAEHDLNEKFYQVVVKERDYERVRCDRLQAERDEARAAIERVQKVHRVDDYTVGTPIVRCVCEEYWPCSTIEALEGAQ